MTDTWRVTQKPTFLTELLGLPPKESHQVLQKVELLCGDPTPDGKVKKALKGLKNLCRLRAGDYRIFYTYEKPFISLLALRRRNEATFDEDIEAEFLGGFDPDTGTAKPKAPDWERILAPKGPEKTKLPEPITPDLLDRLRVPKVYQDRLCRIEKREDLFDCPGVSDEIKLTVDEYLFERPLVDVLQQPDLVADDVSDLLRFKEGSLLGFLLKLDPEQEKFVGWALERNGPTLVKGGPGTGKSTVALYRCRSILNTLPSEPTPRVLFTTYTNALVAYSRQLLEQLLGDRASQVEVRTADQLATMITGAVKRKIADGNDERSALKQAVQEADFVGRQLERQAQRKTIEQLGTEYLIEEIGSVIEARGLGTWEDYAKAARPGRVKPLNAVQRRAVWAVRERFNRVLEDRHQWTWDLMRRCAADIVKSGGGPKPYDAVVVDEAQDLHASTLRMLIGLCAEPNRLFLTADANQSIYGSGFSWADVHEALSFRGRTGLLRANYRSTEQIGRAARSYLRRGELEEWEGEDTFTHSGPPPAVRAVANRADEVSLLARFLTGAARELHFGIGSCAVLVPSEKVGRALAGALSERMVSAEFMPGRDLDLRKPVVKVVTLKSAKGLEFPVVAAAGFLDGPFPMVPKGTPEDAVREILSIERRTLFVAMSRAMRALLVVTPAANKGPLLEGFDASLWNLGA